MWVMSTRPNVSDVSKNVANGVLNVDMKHIIGVVIFVDLIGYIFIFCHFIVNIFIFMVM